MQFDTSIILKPVLSNNNNKTINISMLANRDNKTLLKNCTSKLGLFWFRNTQLFCVIIIDNNIFL